ncbi:MAG: hypothetical protein K2O97_07045, partial [Acetatifactor sp.]|nr:hypothetical protein [Acetatifactor sp.]
MLTRQYHLYSIDTGHFFSNHEKYLHNMYCTYRRECSELQKKLSELKKIPEQSDSSENEYQHYIRRAAQKKEKEKQAKEKLNSI